MKTPHQRKKARRELRAASAPKIDVARAISKTRRIKKELDLMAEDIFVALLYVQQSAERKKALENIRSGVVAAASFLDLAE